MAINLYLVNSPLQVLAANEAAQVYGAACENVLVVCKTNSERVQHVEHINAAAKFGVWHKVIFVRTRFRSRPTYLGLVDCLKLAKYKRSEKLNLFIGDFREEWMHQVIEISGVSSACLLDDGIITVSIQNNYLSKGKFNWIQASRSYPRVKLRSSIKNSVMQLIELPFLKMLGFSGKAQYKIDLFTAYPMAVNDDQNFRLNEYSHIKSYVSQSFESENIFYYFGTKYSESNHFDLEVEIQFLTRVKRYFESCSEQVVYIAHRDDSDEKLSRISREIRWPVKKLDAPAEIWFLKNRKRPTKVAGASTTAVINLCKIYPDVTCLYFRLPLEKVAENKLQSLVDAYNYYENAGFQVVDV